MLRFARYAPPASVVFAALVLLVALDLALGLVIGGWSVLSRAAFLDAAKRAELGGRVSGVLRSAGNAPVAIVVGFSTAREGIDAAAVGGRDPRGARWANLAGSGASYVEMEYYLEPLLESPLAPERIVLALHPVWLAGRASSDEAVGGLRRFSWLARHHNALSLLARRWLQEARDYFVGFLGVPFDVQYSPSQDPWSEARRYTGIADQAFRDAQMRAWERFGWFDEAKFGPDSEDLSALRRLVAAARARARIVDVVMMPEHSRLRARVPAIAEARVRSVLSEVLGSTQAIDLRGVVPDDAFHDLAHVNEAGRELLTTQLSAALFRND